MDTYFSDYNDDIINFNHILIDSPTEKNFELHTHDICELLLLKKGDISALVGEKTYKVKKDTLIIFRSNTPHKIIFDSHKPYERYDILFDENKLANKVFFKIPKNIDLISYKGNTRIIELFDKLDYYYNSFTGNDLKTLITNIIEELLFNIQITPANELEDSKLTTNPVISNAIEYINSHYCEALCLDDICKTIGTTKSNLHHLFTENLNISPKKFINMKRLSKAQKLICLGEKPSNIYKECGYNDYVTFFRNYTMHFGYSPSERDKIIIERKIES